MKTEKKTYERPSMKVYEMRRRTQLLAGSGDGGLNPMGYPTDL